jgi:hypothetical protein
MPAAFGNIAPAMDRPAEAPHLWTALSGRRNKPVSDARIMA